MWPTQGYPIAVDQRGPKLESPLFLWRRFFSYKSPEAIGFNGSVYFRVARQTPTLLCLELIAQLTLSS